jgi:hypothetical protein
MISRGKQSNSIPGLSKFPRACQLSNEVWCRYSMSTTRVHGICIYESGLLNEADFIEAIFAIGEFV